MLDQAGWHLSDKLAIQANITLLPLPPKCPELNPVEKRMAVYAGKLALEPHLHVLRQRRRSLLLRLEQACRPTMACHDHWTAQMGSSAIINESWYKRESEGMKAGAWGRRCYADERLHPMSDRTGSVGRASTALSSSRPPKRKAFMGTSPSMGLPSPTIRSPNSGRSRGYEALVAEAGWACAA